MQRFIKIPNVVLDMKLTPMQLLVYTAVISLKCKSDVAIATGNVIAKRCNITKNSVYSSIKELENIGLIRKVNHFENGRKTSNSYKINDIKGNFTKIEYSIFSYKLLPSEFAAYLSIKSKANHARLAFPSLKQISKLANICIDTVIKAVKRLVRLKLINQSHYIRKCGCFGHNNYTILNIIKMTDTEHPACSDNHKYNDNKISQVKHLCKNFLNKIRYSKFWATILEPLRNVVRKKNIDFITQHIFKLRV